MGKPGIPDRWLPYSSMGRIIPGTRFIACKVPLKDDLLRSLSKNQRFGPKDLLEAFPKTGLLIDLTNTTRYYSKQDFTDNNVRYEKIFCPGKVVPPNSIVKQFFKFVDEYLASENDPDAVIVVHCTHGVNRTGYFICRYMIERLNMSPEEALTNFKKARGHEIERDTYVSDLKNGCKGGNESDLCMVSNRGFGQDRKRPAQQQISNSRRFHGVESNKHNDKRQRYNYKQTSSDHFPSEKWRNNRQSHDYFNKFDKYQNLEEESNCSYNWRDHRNYQSFQSRPHHPPHPPHHHTTSIPPSPKLPLPSHHPAPSSFPQFPARHRVIPPYQGDGERFLQRDNFKGHFTTSSRGATHTRFNPLPDFCQPETFNDVDVVPPTSNIGRGRGNWRGSRSGGRGRRPQRNKY